MKITKKNDTANRAFWKITREALSTVEGWPEWKRNIRVTKYSVGFVDKSSKRTNSGSKKTR